MAADWRVDGLQEQVSRLRKEQIKINGFMSGLMQVRANLPFEDDRDPHGDPFMAGYQQGEALRKEIVREAQCT